MKCLFITTKGERKEIEVELSKKAEKELKNLKRKVCMGCPFGEDCLPNGKCMIEM